MSPVEQIQVIYAVGGTVFIAGFLVAFVTTGARFLWYVRHSGHALPPVANRLYDPDVVRMPVLLRRDMITKGGMFLSFGLIVLLRFLPQETRIAYTTGNVPWALITTIPACIAILVYDWYEIFRIPRAKL